MQSMKHTLDRSWFYTKGSHASGVGTPLEGDYDKHADLKHMKQVDSSSSSSGGSSNSSSSSSSGGISSSSSSTSHEAGRTILAW